MRNFKLCVALSVLIGCISCQNDETENISANDGQLLPDSKIVQQLMDLTSNQGAVENIDITYPISINSFGFETNTHQISFDLDAELYNYLYSFKYNSDNITEFISIEYPVELRHLNNDTIAITNDVELENTLTSSNYDCESLLLNYGDVCSLISAGSALGLVNENCECVEENTDEYDCPELEQNIGDTCSLSTGTGEEALGTVNENCECVEDNTEEYDCPDLNLNIGDPCFLTPGSETADGIINENCECVE